MDIFTKSAFKDGWDPMGTHNFFKISVMPVPKWLSRTAVVIQGEQ